MRIVFLFCGLLLTNVCSANYLNISSSVTANGDISKILYQFVLQTRRKWTVNQHSFVCRMWHQFPLKTRQCLVIMVIRQRFTPQWTRFMVFYKSLCSVLAFGIHSIKRAVFHFNTFPSLFIVFPAFPIIILGGYTVVGGSVYQLKKLRFYYYTELVFGLHWCRIGHWTQRIQNIP